MRRANPVLPMVEGKHVFLASVIVVLLGFSLTVLAQDVVEVAEKDIKYAPEKFTVHLGQTLRIVNRDPFFHKSRISKLSTDGQEGEVVLAAKKENPKTQQDFVFSQPGRYKLRCMVHDGMTAIIDVEN